MRLVPLALCPSTKAFDLFLKKAIASLQKPREGSMEARSGGCLAKLKLRIDEAVETVMR